MQWIKSGIENPSKSEVIGRCGGDEKNEWPRRTDKWNAKNKGKKEYHNSQLEKLENPLYGSWNKKKSFIYQLSFFVKNDFDNVFKNL